LRHSLPPGKGILNGGLGRGELGVVCAATGVGKSHFLTMLGANAMRERKNVVHYTLEMSESLVGLRYDSNLCDIDSDDISDRKEEVIAKYKEMKLGQLFIKEFPTCWATVNNIRAHVEKLNARGFKPDLIIIDYADILRSTRQYDAKRFELQLIYQELRAYASEIDVPIWTASQSNKEGAGADVVDLNNMSEAYGKAMEADVVISLSRKSHEKSLGVGRLFIAKNRAGKDGMVYAMKINTARSTFSLLDTYENQDQKSTSDFYTDDDSVRNKLRLRMKELRDEDELKGLSPQ
jgi:replicative DNA helicase